MDKIYTTKPHYIRCLKPNDANIPDSYNRPRVVEQLRYGGVLEAVRVARSGFPVRLSHTDFYTRYRCIANPLLVDISTLPVKPVSAETNNHAKALLQSLVIGDPAEDVPDISSGEEEQTKKELSRRSLLSLQRWLGKTIGQESIQMGLTKVFLRKAAHDTLEARRSRRLSIAALIIQSSWRGRLARLLLIQCLWATQVIQKYFRGHRGREQVRSIRRTRAALCLQSLVRMMLSRNRYERYYWSLVQLQSNVRRRRDTRLVHIMRVDRATNILLRFARMIPKRHAYLKFKWAILSLQCAIRKRQARKILRDLKVAAKDVGRLQQSNEALKVQMESYLLHSLGFNPSHP